MGRVPTEAELIGRIEEAYDVFRRMPDPDRKYRLPRLGSWPLFVRQFLEAYGWHAATIRFLPPSPEAIDRAVEVVEWFALLNHYPMGAKALWLTYGRGMSAGQAGRALSPIQSKWQVIRKRRAALTALLAILARQDASHIDKPLHLHQFAPQITA